VQDGDCRLIGVVVLGCTGSIGESTLDVLARHPDRFRLVALAANRNVAKLAEQIRRWQPPYAALANEAAARDLTDLLGNSAPRTRVLAGESALEEIATLRDADRVMAAIVGAAGLRSTLAARARARGCCWPTRNLWSWPARGPPQFAHKRRQCLSPRFTALRRVQASSRAGVGIWVPGALFRASSSRI
jgi:1-deoxy-D-xylulose 5-phosphate reductoisomerase